MSQRQPSRLDRLFPRQLARDYKPDANDAWTPSWRPRGRWWMRAQQRGRDLIAQRANILRRLAKPGRAA